jgi:methylthioribulose-1-phosphate dehydratase
VQKERMQPSDLFVLSLPQQLYLRQPAALKPSACTPLFLAAFTARNAGACIHTHSTWAVLITLILEARARKSGREEDGQVFEISHLEQIKGVAKGPGKGNLGYFDTLRVPVIENTAREEDLTPFLERTLEEWPDTYAVLVRRHGLYVWGEDWKRAKIMAECLDYIFQVGVEMERLGVPWVG